MCQSLFIFLNRESNQNVYSGKVSNVNNELIPTLDPQLMLELVIVSGMVILA